MSVTSWGSEAELDLLGDGSKSNQITGALVHRLFNHYHSGSAASGGGEEAEEAQLTRARELLTADERAWTVDPDALVRAAVNGWRRLAARPDVERALASGERFHEVPFSFSMPDAKPPRLLRGTIDCLIRRDDGSFLVVEFKTGRPHASHRRQLDIYVQAVEASQPGHAVEGVLFYV